MSDSTVSGPQSLGGQWPLHLPRMAEVVAGRLRAQIIAGSLGDGDELPRESDMLATIGVSRPTLREALRILETEGLIRIRRGKFGGAVVSRPTVQSAAYHLGLTLQSNQVTLNDLAGARAAIQPTCASLAASLPNAAEVAEELTALVDESEALLGTQEEFTDSAQGFHSRLTELCGNTTMHLIAGTLEAVWTYQERRPARDPEGSPLTGAELLKIQRKTVAEHRRMLRYIAEGNRDGAARTMRRHLGVTHDTVLPQYGACAVEMIASRPLG